jgi:hypothetical protein
MNYKVHSVHETSILRPVIFEGHEVVASVPALIVEFVPDTYKPEKFGGGEGKMVDPGVQPHQASFTHREVYPDKETRAKALADFTAKDVRFAIKIERIAP